MRGKRKVVSSDFYECERALIEKAALHLKWLLRAAARNGRMDSVVYLFEEWKQRTARELGIRRTSLKSLWNKKRRIWTLFRS